MRIPTVEIYTDLHCPWAYLACYRLRLVWPEYAGRVQLVWRALSLEYINQRGTPRPILEVELPLIWRIEPAIPVQPWSRPAWQWPVTFWPAFEALACAQAQGADAAFALSWALRQAFFAEERCPALRHELLAIASNVANEAPLDLAQFEADWDAGRYKAQVISDSRQGWHVLNVPGSPTFVLPDGTQIHNPGGGDAEIDEEHGEVRSYTPPRGDPRDLVRELLERALGSAG